MYDHDTEDSGILPKPVEDSPLDKKLKEKDAMLLNLQNILNKGGSKEVESELLDAVQQHRRLLLDVAMDTFMKKPSNSKLMDSINTLLGQMDKKIRDDRKEKLKDRELEDNKANFSMFVSAINEVASGKLKLPDYGSRAMILDPLQTFHQLGRGEEIRDGELDQGMMELNLEEIESTLE